jgi:non-heme chloroperoxidase
MRLMLISLACLGALVLALIVAGFWLAASPDTKIENLQDIFGFKALKSRPAGDDLPLLKRYAARDGEELAYRIYESSSDRILIFIHGSSYHGGGYHQLASSISASGAAKVILPNLRGHFQSGRRRGDVDYIGQLEDDLADLIRFLRSEGLSGPITLGGHSSGGGLCIRFAGSPYNGLVANYLLLSPIIPTSPAIRNRSAGGWANLNKPRLYGLPILNVFGIGAFNALPIVEFNKPSEFWDGTETLSYSYRLNASYHPRYRYAMDLGALGGKALILVGSDDEAIDAGALGAVFEASAPKSQFTILPGINHFGIFSDPSVLMKINNWISGLPASAG